jgi:glycosyltransferase involved in cell wall biosynthesis
VTTVALDTSEASGPALRGWGRYVRELSRALLAAGEFDYRMLDGSGARGPEIVWEQLGLPRQLRRAGARLVHSPNCFLPLRRPCPGVVTVHDLAFEAHPEDFSRRTGWKYRAITPRAVRSAERVICVSEATRDDVLRRYSPDPERLRVVYSAPALGSGGAEPPRGPYVLAVGDLRAKKNFVRLAEAFRHLHEDGLPHRLVIAGPDSGDGERIRQAAGRAPLELPGYADDQRLDALMRGADLLVHPSLYEGFGLVVVEAMARGCPVAAADATALPETCAGAALLFDPLDSRAIAAAMRRVLEDRALHDDLVARGRARAAEFSWERTAAHTAAVYREVLA